jgi:catechol 2,3-dioxygenase-like lactoylglutathione lyase family enzyme
MPRRAGGQGSSPNSTSETSTQACRFGGTCSRSASAYQRPTERFVYLERADGSQIMLCEQNGRFETGAMERPLGRGVMFQLYVADLKAVLERLAARALTIYLGPREIWRAVGALEFGQREIFVQDPDGYLVMVAQNIGTRAPTESTIV